jgi:hypothetical protein
MQQATHPREVIRLVPVTGLMPLDPGRRGRKPTKVTSARPGGTCVSTSLTDGGGRSRVLGETTDVDGSDDSIPLRGEEG